MDQLETKSQAPVWAIRAIVLTCVLLIILIAFFLPGMVALLIVGALLAYLLNPAVQFIERRGFSRIVSATVVFGVLTLLVGAVFVVLVPAVAAQFEGLLTLDVDRATETFDAVNTQVNAWFTRLGVDDVNIVESLTLYVTERIPNLFAVLPDALSFLGYLALFPFVVFFLLKDGRALKKGSLSLVPNRYFEFSLGLLFKMDRQLGNYLRGQFIEALIVGVLSVLALWILDIPYYLPVGIFAGAANIVPYLGPSAGAVIALLVVALTGGSASSAILVVALFGAIQTVDNNVVHPLVISKNVKMHPLVVVMSVVAGGQLFGFLGLLLAVPAVAIIQVIVVETIAYLKRYRFLHV